MTYLAHLTKTECFENHDNSKTSGSFILRFATLKVATWKETAAIGWILFIK